MWFHLRVRRARPGEVRERREANTGRGLVHHQSPPQLLAAGSRFRPAAPGGAREAIILPPPRGAGGGETRCVTPRQTCPRPEGFGRNLRSKTRWFTGFCNSHQVSHFATFFIDARAEISVAESRYVLSRDRCRPRAPADRARAGTRLSSCSLARSAPGFVVAPGATPWGRSRRREGGRGTPPRVLHYVSAGRSAGQVSTMILPQVHLRKPCYDFSFL